MDSNKTNMDHVFIAFAQANQGYSSYVVAQRGNLSKELVAGFPDYVFKLSNGFIYSYEPGKQTLFNLMEKKAPSNYSFSNKLLDKKEFNLYPPPANWTVTKFANLNISLVSLFKDKFKLESGPANKMNQLYPAEYLQLLAKDKEKNPDWKKDVGVVDEVLFFIRQISVPFSTVFLPAIGVCIGILDPRRKQASVYFGIGAVIFALYFSLSLCHQLILKLVISPYTILYLPALVLIVILSVLFRWRSIYPPSCSFMEFLKYETFRLKQRRVLNSGRKLKQ